MTDRDLTRRTFGGVAVLGVAAPLLAACASDPEPSATESATTSATGSSSPTPTASGKPAPGGEALVEAGEVPVGGGVVLKEAEVVVTQPAEGDFRCFTAICTHAGCVVGSVQDNQISCPCHGSVFSGEDGSVVQGPATAPLQAVEVALRDGQVTRA